MNPADYHHTIIEELRGPVEESRECGLQDSNEIPKFFCDSHKQVVEQHILLGLFQCPLTARYPVTVQQLSSYSHINVGFV